MGIKKVRVCIPECTEGFLIVDVCRTQSSDHGRTRVPPLNKTKRSNQMKLHAKRELTLTCKLLLHVFTVQHTHTLTKVLSQQPGEY